MFKFKIVSQISSEKSFFLEILPTYTVYQLFLEIGITLPSPFQISFGFPPQTLRKNSHGKLLIQDVLENSTLLKIEEISSSRKFCRAIVPADNNCLFTAVKECLAFNQNSLRQVVCNTIKADPKKYNDAFLEGKQPQDYIAWISKGESWGGEIEIEALAEALEICIKVVIVQLPRIQIYNPKDASKSIFLIYDGIHFDYMHHRLNIN